MGSHLPSPGQVFLRPQEGTQALPSGLALYLCLSQGHFAIPTSTLCSKDGARLISGRTGYMTGGPADRSLRLWCILSLLQAWESPSVQSVFVD